MPLQLDEWFVVNQKNLTSYLFRLTTNRQDAEDLCQETYLKAKESINSFRNESSLKTWIYTIATNKARDHWRVKKRWQKDAQDKCREAAETIDEEREKILGAFDHLPEKKFEVAEHINYCITCLSKNLTLDQQIAVVLSEIFEFKRREIAEILKKTEGVVKHLLFEGRKHLQEIHYNRCALINKAGVCYQCSELDDFFRSRTPNKNSETELTPLNPSVSSFDDCMKIAKAIDPLLAKNTRLHESLLDVLQRALTD